MVERLGRAASARPRDVLASHRDDLLALAARHGFLDARVFGSVAKGTDGPGSDVDLLVSAPAGTGLMAVSTFALAAQDLLGLPVDLVTDGGLRADHPIRREAVRL